MELGTFAPRPREDVNGDQLKATDAVDKPLVVHVREHKTGIKTKFNQDPKQSGYKPDGADGVIVDVANVDTDEVFIDVLWLNGAVVDNLAPYVGQVVPVQLVWQAPANGGNSYISLVALVDAQLVKAQQWAAANPARFDAERAKRRTDTSDTATGSAPNQLPTLPQPPAAAPPTAAPVAAADPNDPAVAALLAQLAAQQQKAS